MANINKIKLSGTTYSIQDENACKVVELTQAEYDALPATAKTSNSLFVITDATGGDLSNYYTKSETSGATQISTALNAKQDTLVSGTNIKTINNESLLGSGNIDIQGGGGKAVSGGTNISITTGETADTINCTLPITVSSIKYYFGENNTIGNYHRINYGFIFGAYNTVNGIDSSKEACHYIIGNGNTDYGAYNTIIGAYNTVKNRYPNGTINSILIGDNNVSSADTSYNVFNRILIGSNLLCLADGEIALGRYNLSTGDTKFSIGDGNYAQNKHNAFEIKNNGDIYIVDTNDTSTTNYYQKPMIKLQDALGGGGSSYTAGDGIDITNDVISVTGKVETSDFNTYTAATATAIGDKLAVSDFNTYSGTVDTAINSKASQSDLSTLSGTVTAHTANTDIHVTTAQTAAWNAKSNFSGDYSDLTNKPTIPTVPTSNTAFTNDAGYITSSALDDYATTGDVQTATADMATKTWVGNQGYLTEHQSLSNYYTKSETSGATEISTALGNKQDTLVSGTNIKTINNESILGSGNITIQGGGSVDQTIISGSTNAVAGGAVYTQLDGLKLKKITQSAYDNLATKDSNTLYVING